MSSELQVTSSTPPTFIFQTDKDTGVPAENAVSFYLALRKAKVPAEMHIYEKGPHGVGLAANVPGVNTWPDRCIAWLRGLTTAMSWSQECCRQTRNALVIAAQS